MNITISGAGYVGFSLAVLLAKDNHVTAVDILPERIDKINKRISPVQDAMLSESLEKDALQLEATSDAETAYKQAELIVIATPTDYDPERGCFDVSSVCSVLEQVTAVNPQATVVIRSTIPIGFTEKAREKYDNDHILYSPEFLRESMALYDHLHPSRIIVGCDPIQADQRRRAKAFADLLSEAAREKDIPVRIMGTGEAEAVKLFSNTYLAMRIGYFNELDMYAESKGLNTEEIIEGVSLDPRVGNYYNNPSFGYGGYCLPKDTRQLLAEFHDVPGSLIPAIVETNRIRKEFIAEDAAARAKKQMEGRAEAKQPVIGIFCLAMKKNSDNYRQSAVLEIMDLLEKKGTMLIIYEPSLPDGSLFEGREVINDFERFAGEADLILANRYESLLDPVREKVYSRDLFARD